MAGDRFGSLLLEGFHPVLSAPFAGVGRVHPDHGDAAAGRHRGESGAELGGGDAGGGAAEPLPTCAAAHRVAADGAGIGDVEVLDHHRGALSVGGGIEQGGDRRPDRPVAWGCGQSGRVDGDPHRVPDRVPGSVAPTAGEVIGVEIDTQDWAGR